MLESLKQKLAEGIKTGLPGATAQNRMASTVRQQELRASPHSPRHAAVLILLFEQDGRIFMPLIRRPIYDGVHSGQMALPGGMQEPEDKNLTQTALRETWEEIGVEVPETQVIGQLSDLYIPPSNTLVTPVVAWQANIPKYKIDPREVDATVNISLADFQNPKLQDQIQIEVRGGIKFVAPAFLIDGHTIWGATAMMLSELLFILEK